MSTPIDVAPADDRELVLARVLDAPREKVWRCWTEGDILKRWFAPAPYTTPLANLDVRPGGYGEIVMAGPDGTEMAAPGVYLHVEPPSRLVMTDAFGRDWTTTEKAFLIMDLRFDDAGEGRTRYVARVRHWSVADREAHEAMGFHQGWGVCADQLEAVARTL